MTPHDALRRIEALEQQGHHVDIRPMAEAAADALGFSVDELLAEAARLDQRVEQIGIAAVTAELAEQAERLAERCGISVEQLNSDVDAFFAEHGWQPFGSAAS